MKRKLLRIFLILHFAFFIFNSSQAQFAFIPDTNFRNFLMNNGFAGCMKGDSLDTTFTAVVNATSIICNNQNIQNLSGIEYFDNLQQLNIIYNQVLYFPRLPESLLWFYCGDNNLSTLPALPSALTVLNFEHNNLINLPPLPPTLISLNCSQNQLSSIYSYPPYLIELICDQNAINYLAPLPSSMRYFYCSENQLTSLPFPLPDSLFNTDC